MREDRFAIRTIREGRICLYGQEWKPDERFLRYDGRLNGRRMAFGRYTNPDGSYMPLLCLWGTEGAYRCEVCATKDCEDPDHWPGPHCVDGKFVWEWWRPVESGGG